MKRNLCSSIAGFTAIVAAGFLTAGIGAVNAQSVQNSSAPGSQFDAPLPDLVVPADTFNIAIVGFNSVNSGAYLVSPLTGTFGLTQTFPGAGLGGQTVTVTSSETFNGLNTVDTVTISVPTNFIPTGTTIGGTPVTLLEMDLGGYNAGTDTLDFLTPVVGATYTGSLLYSGGTLTLSPAANTVLTNNNMSLYTAEGVNAGGSNLSPFAIRSFTFTATYPTVVPEPSTFALGAFGIGALLMRKKLFRRRA
jgi:hypothetical protein